jgi:hypothetical protein
LTYPVLRQPDVTRPFTVYTAGCGYALGAILAQQDDNNQEYVCHYASRLLKNAEITEITVVTDHNALVWLMSVPDPTGKLARWPIYLQQSSFSWSK